MTETGEHIDLTRPEEYRQGQAYAQLMYLMKREDAISYTSFYYYQASNESMWAVPIAKADETLVAPSTETIVDGTYPLVRSIQMNLLNRPQTLEHTIPFVMFGLSHPELIFTTGGYVPLSSEAIDTMFQRLRGAPYDGSLMVEDTDDDSILSVMECVVIGVGVLLLCCFMVIFYFYSYSRKRKS